jgi:hypothetical protein
MFYPGNWITRHSTSCLNILNQEYDDSSHTRLKKKLKKIFQDQSVDRRWNYKYKESDYTQFCSHPPTWRWCGSQKCICLMLASAGTSLLCFRQYSRCKSQLHNVLIYFRQPREIRFWNFTAPRLMIPTYQITRCCSRNNQHYALLCTSYMFRQYSTIIREILGSVWVDWNTDRMGGISCNLQLPGLCAGVSWFGLLRFASQRSWVAQPA